MTTPRIAGRPKALDRLLLGVAETRLLDGLQLAVSDGDPAHILPRLEEALVLIKTYDLRRYHRLHHDLKRIWVRVLPGPIGIFIAALRACVLDSRFVLDTSVTAGEIAATIVHEATHARISRRGVSYSERVRYRIEAACRRQEIAFGNRLPDGAAVCQRAERALGLHPEFWTDSAFQHRQVKGTFEALEYLGVPRWSFSILRMLWAIVARVRRWASGLTRGG